MYLRNNILFLFQLKKRAHNVVNVYNIFYFFIFCFNKKKEGNKNTVYAFILVFLKAQ